MLQPSQQRDKSSYLSEDTIAALTTAVGGAISVVRVSGPASFTVVSRVLKDPALINRAESRKLYRARLVDVFAAEGLREVPEIDDALFVRFAAPETFTGEDVVELHLHGGALIASRVLKALLSSGARQALPGEFSFRAVRNGKFTISQASATADLIAASNETAASLALEKLSGSEAAWISDIAKDLKSLSALGAIGIDFSDQDVEEVSLVRLKERVIPLLKTLRKLRQSYRKGSWIQDGVRVAFVGLPNAGKSSFFNALLGEDRSIVSDLPGTTRDILRERLTLQDDGLSITLRLEDTAGLRAGESLVEKMGIDRSLSAAQGADILLFLIDPTQHFEDIRQQWERLGSPSRKTIAVFTKSDLWGPSEKERANTYCQALCIPERVTSSAVTGDGMDAVAKTIVRFCAKWITREPGEIVITRLDQAQALDGAIADLERAKDSLELDLFAADIRQALHSLSPLIGETLTDDILGQIFSEFCIGK